MKPVTVVWSLTNPQYDVQLIDPEEAVVVFRKPGTDLPAPKMDLRVWSKTDFKLLTEFTYFPSDGSAEVKVNAHSPDGDDTTDLASVPSLLWGLLASYGRQLRAALLHDQLCNEAKAIGDRKQAYAARRHADQLFLLAMRDRGDTKDDLQKRVPWFRARLFWAGVGFGRYWAFRKFGAILMTAQLLVSIATAHAAIHTMPLTWFSWAYPFGWGDHRATYAITYAVMLLLSFAWFKDFGVVLIGVLVVPIVAPVLLLTFLAQCLLSLPDFVVKLFDMDGQPAPSVGPVVVQGPHLTRR